MGWLRVVLVPEVVIAMWRRGYPVVWLVVEEGGVDIAFYLFKSPGK
jgi:hypothetical protein